MLNLNDENPALIDTRAARKLTATYCACCALPLSDADSVEIGIGPVCRRKTAKADVGQPSDWDRAAELLAKHASENPSDDNAREIAERAMANLEAISAFKASDKDQQKICNMITHRIAALQSDTINLGDLVEAVRAMGRPALATKIAKHRYAIRLAIEGRSMLVTTPYSETFKSRMWANGYRLGQWDKVRKVYVVALSSAAKLHRALVAAYPGQIAVGAAGTEFRIGA